MRLDEKELYKWRKKIGISTPGRYLSQRHPRAPKPPQYFGPNSKALRVRNVTPKQQGAYTRRNFTKQEIETNWLALCRVFDYCGGSKKLLMERTGISVSNINRYIKVGRLTPDAATVIGKCKDLPFSRNELRPDISDGGWKDFDAYYLKVQAHRNRRKYKTAHKAI